MDPIARVVLPVSDAVPTGTTNAYVIGTSDAVLVDPAGRSSDLDARLDQRSPNAVLVTHAHPDHVGALEQYAAEYDLDVYARAGYEDRFERATGVTPDATLRNGDTISTGGLDISVTATPGHAPDHIALTVRDAADAAASSEDDQMLVGDLAVAEGSVFVGSPDGDMRGYLTALRRLHARAPEALLPGHGPPITDPAAVLSRLVDHRLDRERRVLAAVRDGATTPDAVVEAAYDKDLSGVRDLARRAVIAHLEKLAVEDALDWDGERARPIEE
ncbi:Glyoxylase, beta-lactamase superfamily II [Natronoarchaeum philippinense]|uniref:Glyoxylase, beta-lactamase superfamily II n=1 Tax=Natronoarchaeum philippinense TaxID=558529 RepID=A0A285NUE2_NATPI|nr:MBL fold metallo-hydrolase [Natronoarchaeum philippinense]SNZ13102.1 Glyoxylase, beta-lactamase superfamily II [Natronoarchaeum philippinense]